MTRTRFLIAALALGLIGLAPGVASAAKKGVTKKETVVRAGPKDDAKQLGKLPKGKKLLVGKIQGDWLLVRFQIKKNGKAQTVTGWVAKASVQPVKAGGGKKPPPKNDDPPPDTAVVKGETGNGAKDDDPPPGVVARPPYQGPLQKGISVEAGPAALANVYRFTSGSFSQPTGVVPHYGAHVAASYYFLRYVGVVASFQGGQGTVNANINNTLVEGLQTQILAANAAIVGRYGFGPVFVYGGAGYRFISYSIPAVPNGAGQNLFLNSNTYTGVTAGAGLGVGLGRRGAVTVGGDYWVVPGLSESGGTNTSGELDSIFGVSAELAARYKVTDQIGASLVVSATQLQSTFTGTGNRFGRAVADSTQNDRFFSAGLAGSYVF